MTITAARKVMTRRMVDDCTITRPRNGIQELDANLQPITTPEPVWAGKCAIADRLSGAAVDRGHGDFRAHHADLRISHDVEEEVRIDDHVSINSGPAAGTSWVVTAVMVQSREITRRFELRRLVQEVQHS